MKLRNCNKCSLCKKRLHVSTGRGKKPANVMIIFGMEPCTEEGKGKEREFLRELNYLLKYDWYKTYAIKCSLSNCRVKSENIKSCRIWLKKEFEKVDPYLVILVGNIALASVLGMKKRNLSQNVFWIKGGKRFFITESILGNSNDLENNLKRLQNYIKGFYHG